MKRKKGMTFYRGFNIIPFLVVLCCFAASHSFAAGSCPDDGSLSIPTTPSAGYTPLPQSCEVGNPVVGQWVLISDDVCVMPGNWTTDYGGWHFELVEGRRRQWQVFSYLIVDADVPCSTVCGNWLGAGEGCNNCLNAYAPDGHTWPDGPPYYGNPSLHYCYGNMHLQYFEWECF